MDTSMNGSICRQNFTEEAEKALNDQINMELTASYHYLSAASYFGRDDVALKGFEIFFKKASDEEREHAHRLIQYQNMRGGRVVYQDIKCGPEWQSAMQSLETALQIELSVNENLLKLHKIADTNSDPQMTDFIECEFLVEQVKSQKELADMITNLKRVGEDGIGLFLFDQNLQKT